jgi:hypothetical protein
MAARPEAPAPSAWERLGLRGLEVQVRGGIMLPSGPSPVQAPNLYGMAQSSGDPTGDILRGKESPYGPDVFGISVALGYRFFPWLSAGAFFTYASFAANDGTDTGDYCCDGTSQLERQFWSVGGYARYYLTTLHPRLHPWIELGLGYSDDNANYVRGGGNGLQAVNGQPETQLFVLEEKGLFVPLTLGLDVRLAPLVSLGPAVGYARVFSLGGCITVEVDSFSPVPGTSTCKSPPVDANGDGIFFAGIFLKLTLGPAASSP